MSEKIKKQINDAFEDIFLPMFMLVWAVGLSTVSFFLVISVLWEIYNFF